jgi:hypothetical protein
MQAPDAGESCGSARLHLAEFVRRQAAGPWAAPALVCLLVIVILFAIAGQTVNAPFVYTPPA